VKETLCSTMKKKKKMKVLPNKFFDFLKRISHEQNVKFQEEKKTQRMHEKKDILVSSFKQKKNL